GNLFSQPVDITVDAEGNLYVADYTNQMIRKIDSKGDVSTLINTVGFHPVGVAAGNNGILYVTTDQHQVARVTYNTTTAAYEASLVIGTTQGDTDGMQNVAQISNPQGITTDASGNLYFAELSNKIKKIYQDTGSE